MMFRPLSAASLYGARHSVSVLGMRVVWLQIDTVTNAAYTNSLQLNHMALCSCSCSSLSMRMEGA